MHKGYSEVHMLPYRVVDTQLCCMFILQSGRCKGSHLFVMLTEEALV